MNTNNEPGSKPIGHREPGLGLSDSSPRHPGRSLHKTRLSVALPLTISQPDRARTPLELRSHRPGHTELQQSINTDETKARQEVSLDALFTTSQPEQTRHGRL